MKTWKITNRLNREVVLHINSKDSVVFKPMGSITTTDESIVKYCKQFAYTKQFIIEEVKEGD